MPPRTTNGFAIASMIFGILGGILLSVIFGIIALVQIRRTRARGRGFAITGLVLSAVWLVGIVAAGVVLALSDLGDELAGSGGPRSSSGSAARLFPRPGECFDLPPGAEVSANVTIVPCAPPHDAQTILTFELPGGPWPGAQQVETQAFGGCETRIVATFRTRTPVPDAQPYVLIPRRLGWLAGDHTVTCALSAATGAKLTGPVVIRDPGTREWSELAVGDCFNTPDDDAESTIVELAPCTSAHTGQATHTFTLPDAVWPGETTAAAKAEQGCTERQDAHFAEHPPTVELQGWHIYPSQETWAQGDREVVCYVTGENRRPLRRSVMTR